MQYIYKFFRAISMFTAELLFWETVLMESRNLKFRKINTIWTTGFRLKTHLFFNIDHFTMSLLDASFLTSETNNRTHAELYL